MASFSGLVEGVTVNDGAVGSSCLADDGTIVEEVVESCVSTDF